MVDFFIDEVISVELKAITQLEPVHIVRAISYLEIGLLINFREISLNFKLVSNKKHHLN